MSSAHVSNQQAARRKVRRVAGALVGIAALSGVVIPACDPDNPDGTTHVQYALEAVEGTEQTGLAGQSLEKEVVVILTQRLCKPEACDAWITAPSSSIEWAVIGGGGRVSEPSSLTGSDGKARVTWTMGPTAGAATLRASGPGTLITDIRATAIVRQPVLEVVSGATPTQVAPVNSALPSPVVVRVTDFSNAGVRVPLAGSTVTWNVTTPGASTSSATSITNTQGEASTSWTLGSTVGPQTLRASIPSVTGADPSSVFQVSIAATALRADTRQLRLISSASPRGIVGRALASPIVVEYVTINGTTGAETKVPNTPVTFTPAANNGSALPATAVTDANGQVSATWTLGTAEGAESMVVSTPTVSGFDAASVFSVTVNATADPAAVVLRDDFSVGTAWSSTATRNDFGAWTFSRTVQPSGGNPGGFASVVHTTVLTTNPTFASIFSQHLYTGGTYTPSTQGAIVSIDYQCDRIAQQGAYDAFVIVQDGREYRAEFPGGSTFNNTSWQTAQLTNLTPANFSPGPGPNFSNTGTTMQFGFTRGNSERFAFFVAGHGIDNFRVTIKR
jgi:hypothetical protein